MNPSNYIPVDCNFHDRLLHWATMKERVVAVVLDEGMEVESRGIIEDVWTESGAEFMRMDNGQTFRLDHVQSVNGYPSRAAGAFC